ncbi:hypothetical protein P10VF_143 [Rhizobium phage vB_RleM_P10VF]|uniref:Uncharacterized protein n=1 Tax=Rhizobium phage vB_RleM_P10VF TaxID=1527770 RepID=A0A076YQ91_9CAUD|nr:hypothetical protein P10VF_143 [Rhizobium phage vB_RleM_P10VF]AIK68356.1 hypothetical protein P10VF_143 [Rhizobium phage vB_RleM_P10VF]
MKVRVNSSWHLYGYTELNVDNMVEVIEDNGNEVDIEFEDYRGETSIWTVPEIILDMREYRITQETGGDNSDSDI